MLFYKEDKWPANNSNIRHIQNTNYNETLVIKCFIIQSSLCFEHVFHSNYLLANLSSLQNDVPRLVLELPAFCVIVGSLPLHSLSTCTVYGRINCNPVE